MVLDGTSLHLSSGKIIAHRTAPAIRSPHYKPLAARENTKHSQRQANHLHLEDIVPVHTSHATTSSPPDAADSPSAPPTQALTLGDRRRLLTGHSSFLASAVASMSARDRVALVHLSPGERRVMVVEQFKQQGRGLAVERKYWCKLERRQDRPAVGGKVYIGGG